MPVIRWLRRCKLVVGSLRSNQWIIASNCRNPVRTTSIWLMHRKSTFKFIWWIQFCASFQPQPLKIESCNFSLRVTTRYGCMKCPTFKIFTSKILIPFHFFFLVLFSAIGNIAILSFISSNKTIFACCNRIIQGGYLCDELKIDKFQVWWA